MRKNLIVVSLVALFVSFAAVSFAEVGIQFRVPYQGLANKSDVKSGASGSSVLLTFDLDAGTTVGILTEQINYIEKPAAGGADVAGRYNVNAIRITKAISEPVYVGIDLGTASFSGPASAQQASLADILGGVKLLSSKGKITSYLNVEVAYRLLTTSAAPTIGGGVTDFGGAFVSLGAGLTF
ncbi:MAG: hypothetical protein HW415_917 [Deltaproteobacteria bacterium]|nr:hypothetical protein [Deltaproteobacteria bacterium]